MTGLLAFFWVVVLLNVLWLDFHLAEVVQGMALDVSYVLWGPA